MRKSDESPKDDLRVLERVFQDDDRWFVRTREGMRGPFSSRRAAEAEADLFVDTVQYLEQHRPSLPPDVDDGDITLVDLDKSPPWR